MRKRSWSGNVASDVPADLDYNEDGSHPIEPISQAKDPDEDGRRAVYLAHGRVPSVSHLGAAGREIRSMKDNQNLRSGT